MNDTSDRFRNLVRRELMDRSPEERIRMGSEMHESARALVLASLPEGLPVAERRYRLFLRFYDRDFDDVAKQAIKHGLNTRSPSAG